MKTHTLTLTEEQIDKYGLRELVPFTGWAKEKKDSKYLVYFENNIAKYGIDQLSNWKEAYAKYNTENDRPATPEEIEKGLIEMAKKMGFKDGVKVKSFVHNRYMEIFKSEYDFMFVSSYNKLHFGVDKNINKLCVVIFENGKWATIIEQSKEMTIEEIQKELGYKIKIVE